MNVLLQANEIVRRKWRTTGTGWKVFLAIFIVIVALISLAGFIIWAFLKLVKSLGTGLKGDKTDFYFPRTARRR